MVQDPEGTTNIKTVFFYVCVCDFETSLRNYGFLFEGAYRRYQVFCFALVASDGFSSTSRGSGSIHCLSRNSELSRSYIIQQLHIEHYLSTYSIL